MSGFLSVASTWTDGVDGFSTRKWSNFGVRMAGYQDLALDLSLYCPHPRSYHDFLDFGASTTAEQASRFLLMSVSFQMKQSRIHTSTFERKLDSPCGV